MQHITELKSQQPCAVNIHPMYTILLLNAPKKNFVQLDSAFKSSLAYIGIAYFIHKKLTQTLQTTHSTQTLAQKIVERISKFIKFHPTQ